MRQLVASLNEELHYVTGLIIVLGNRSNKRTNKTKELKTEQMNLAVGTLPFFLDSSSGLHKV